MKSIKHIISLLSRKVAQSTSPTDALSSTEMDHLFGGKPEEVVSEQTYWWFDDEEILLHSKSGSDSFSPQP